MKYPQHTNALLFIRLRFDVRRAAFLILITCFSVAGVRSADLQKHDSARFGSVDWNGLYIGGHIGGKWSNDAWTFVNGRTSTWAIDNFDQSAINSRTFIGGLQAGFMRQFGSGVVAGFDLSGTLSGRSRSIASPFFASEDRFGSSTRWLLLGQARLGASFDRVLLFAQGGLVAAGTKIEVSSTNSFVRNERQSSNRLGWTIGAGAQYRFNERLSAGLEYNFYVLSDKSSYLLANGPPTDLLRAERQGHIGKLTLNHHF